MIRMGGADAFMLAMETPRAYMHTFKVAILDPSTAPGGWSFESWREEYLESPEKYEHEFLGLWESDVEEVPDG